MHNSIVWKPDSVVLSYFNAVAVGKRDWTATKHDQRLYTAIVDDWDLRVLMPVRERRTIDHILLTGCN